MNEKKSSGRSQSAAQPVTDHSCITESCIDQSVDTAGMSENSTDAIEKSSGESDHETLPSSLMTEPAGPCKHCGKMVFPSQLGFNCPGGGWIHDKCIRATDFRSALTYIDTLRNKIGRVRTLLIPVALYMMMHDLSLASNGMDAHHDDEMVIIKVSDFDDSREIKMSDLRKLLEIWHELS